MSRRWWDQTRQGRVKPGERYGRLVAIKFLGRGKKTEMRWRFRCDCGNLFVTMASLVRNGKTKSCGCLNAELAANLGRASATHRMSYSPEHNCWTGMRGRCENPNNRRFSYYGGRGIKVCKRWQKFENFYADMGSRPSPMHSLDRKDNDGDYKPSNCRWATKAQQAQNRRWSGRRPANE